MVSQPGSKGSDWRVHGVFDLGTGGFSHLELTDNHGAEGLDRGTPEPGDVWIADRNYARARVLQNFRDISQDKADFIVRVRWKAFSLTSSDGTPFHLIEHLNGLPVDEHPHEVEVLADAGKGRPCLPLRLIVLRKSPEAAEAARKKLRRAAPRKQKRLDPRSLVAAEFLILVTSLPAQNYPAEEILAAYRLRWQIELAFKRLKSLLHIDKLPTRTAAQSWLYAHLILALLSEHLTGEILDFSPQPMLDAGYVPSLWKVQKTAIKALIRIILGPVHLDQFLRPDGHLHQCLAHPPRQRKPAVQYPLRC